MACWPRCRHYRHWHILVPCHTWCLRFPSTRLSYTNASINEQKKTEKKVKNYTVLLRDEFFFWISFSHSTKCVLACYLLLTICRSPPFIARAHTLTRGQEEQRARYKKRVVRLEAKNNERLRLPTKYYFHIYFFCIANIRLGYETTHTIYLSQLSYCFYYRITKFSFVLLQLNGLRCRQVRSCVYSISNVRTTIGNHDVVAVAHTTSALLAAIMRVMCCIIYSEHFNNGN